MSKDPMREAFEKWWLNTDLSIDHMGPAWMAWVAAWTQQAPATPPAADSPSCATPSG